MIRNATRKFTLQGRPLKDIAGLTPQQVMDHYAKTYPELMTATIEQKVQEGVIEIEFVTQAKVKG